jgi:hypothetical protein
VRCGAADRIAISQRRAMFGARASAIAENMYVPYDEKLPLDHD